MTTSISSSTRPTTSRTASTASPTTSRPRPRRRASCSPPISCADAVNLPLISAKERGAGGGHIRFNMAGGDAEPHLAVPGRHLQEGALPRAERARHHPLRRGLLADVARGPGAAALRLAGRHPDRAAQPDVPPALQHRPDAGALSRLQARGRARCATRKACRWPGSAGASAATRSTMPTKSPKSARCSPTRSPSTAWRRRWTTPMRRSLPDLPPKLAQREAAE